MKPLIEGITTALVTPFTVNGEIDLDSFRNLIANQWENGIKQFVVNGTTAESPTLSKDEIEKLFLELKNRLPEARIILGSGTNSTKSSIEKTNWAKSLGADAALVVVPYYNKPSQEGLYQHFEAIEKNTEIPIVLYNVPGRTVVSMSKEVTVKLMNLESVIGIKEASGKLNIYKSEKEKFFNFSGDDDSWVDYCLEGGDGVISVISHLLPKPMSEAYDQIKNKSKSFNKDSFTNKFSQITSSIYLEPNPTPVKYCLKKLGIIESDYVRLPLVPPNQDVKLQLDSELKKAGLI